MAILELEIAPGEQARLQQEADRAGVTVSDWARRKLFGPSAVTFTINDGMVYDTTDPSSETAKKDGTWMPGVDYLLSLTPEERRPFLEAAVEDALPLYEADWARPEAERQLTADLETGDFHDYAAVLSGEGNLKHGCPGARRDMAG